MDFSKYYTPPTISKKLIGELNIKTPKSIIDICCGGGNLLAASKRKWSTADLYGVDIEKVECGKAIQFVQMDGRTFSKKNQKKYDLILGNPPFSYCKEKTSDFFPQFKHLTTNRLENQMLISNLELLSKDGTLLIIMPSTFVEGEKNHLFRLHLSQNYYVSKIIKLPTNVFKGKINSYALFIKNTKPKGRTLLQKMQEKNGRYFIKDIEYIKKANCNSGMWINFCNTIEFANQYTNTALEVFRGNISTNQFTLDGDKVLHTSKDNQNWSPSERNMSKGISSKTKLVSSGDLIVSRVGKSAGRWFYYTGEDTPISDCLLVVKNLPEEIINSLNINSFLHLVKGVAARYVTASDLYNACTSLVNQWQGG